MNFCCNKRKQDVHKSTVIIVLRGKRHYVYWCNT